MLGVLELLKPSTYFIQVTFTACMHNKGLLDLVKDILPHWMMLATEDQKPLLDQLASFVQKGYPDVEYTLPQPIDFYLRLFEVSNMDELIAFVKSRLTKLKFLANAYNRIQLLQNPITDYSTVEDVFSQIITDLYETHKVNMSDKLYNAKQLLNLSQMTDTKIVSLIPELDVALGGFYVNNLYVLAAGLGQGKSFTLLNIAVGISIFVKAFEEYYSQVFNGKKPVVIYVSLENTVIQIKNRLFALLNDTPLSVNKTQNTPLKTLFDKIDNLYVISYSDEMTDYLHIDNLVRMLSNKGEHPVAIILDYMDELHAPSVSEYRHKLGFNARMLRKIAMQHNTCVITATQINRKGIEEGNVSVVHLSESIEHGKVTDGLIGLVPVKTDKSMIITNQPVSKDILKASMESSKSDIKIANMYHTMFIKILKNRPNLLVGHTYVISSSNLTGFYSLINGLNYEISLYLISDLHKYLGENWIMRNYDILNRSVVYRQAPYIRQLSDRINPSQFRYGYNLIAQKLGVDHVQPEESIDLDIPFADTYMSNNNSEEVMFALDEFENFQATQEPFDLDI